MYCVQKCVRIFFQHKIVAYFISASRPAKSGSDKICTGVVSYHPCPSRQLPPGLCGGIPPPGSAFQPFGIQHRGDFVQETTCLFSPARVIMFGIGAFVILFTMHRAVARSGFYQFAATRMPTLAQGFIWHRHPPPFPRWTNLSVVLMQWRFRHTTVCAYPSF